MEIENIIESQSETKNTLFEMKGTLEGINRVDETNIQRIKSET